ncbi:MAG: hypothetical protein AAB817_00925, partial [Patescibacteria group bacterium]
MGEYKIRPYIYSHYPHFPLPHSIWSQVEPSAGEGEGDPLLPPPPPPPQPMTRPAPSSRLKIKTVRNDLIRYMDASFLSRINFTVSGFYQNPDMIQVIGITGGQLDRSAAFLYAMLPKLFNEVKGNKTVGYRFFSSSSTIKEQPRDSAPAARPVI